MNISDVIEEFIYETMGTESSLNLSRNELAQFFDCAPSQINYVLSTRFTFEKGFVCDSRRGGGGYISIARVAPGRSGVLASLESLSAGGGLSYQKACRVLDYLTEQETLSEGEAGILKTALSDKALALPLKVKDMLRANILRNVLLSLEQNSG
jgi:transcriptional regulator CtsR